MASLMVLKSNGIPLPGRYSERFFQVVLQQSKTSLDIEWFSEYQTNWQPDRLRPFEYRTCQVFESLLYKCSSDNTVK
jgi:hypothetical protein